MGMVGNDMASSCSTRRRRPSRSLPKVRATAAALRVTPWAWAGVVAGQVLAQNLQQGLQGRRGSRRPRCSGPVGVRPDEVMATLEKLADLKAKGILTQEEFDTKKASC